MTTGLLITNGGKTAIATDLAGGADLVLTHVAFGDASGVPYMPNEAQVALVNERYRATIASVAVVAGAIVIDAVIPEDTPDGSARPSHGFNVAEAGLYSAAGTLIGLARMNNGYKSPPGSGQVSNAGFRFKLPVANPSAITVVIDPQAQIILGRHVRAPWLTVDGVLNAPPGAPNQGDTYIIGTAPTGAWVGFTHRIAQWVGVWSLASAPIGHQVVDNSKDRYAGNRWLERTATGWDAGLTRLVQRQPGNVAVAGGAANALEIALDPAPASWADLVNVPLFVRFTALNTDAANLSIIGLAGEKSIAMPGGKYPCPKGTLRDGAVGILMYNGTNVEYLNAPVPAATNFFVKATGSDANVGSVAAPLQTVIEAMRRTPVGGICNVALQSNYQHDQIIRLNGRRLNIQGFNDAGNALQLRNFTFAAAAIPAGSQDPVFTGVANYPNNVPCFILGAGDHLQSNSIGWIRNIGPGGPTANTGHFISDGLASLDMNGCSLNSPASGVNTTWFVAALNRLSLNLNIVGLTGQNSGHIYSNANGGAPLASGGDPNSLWNFMCNLTSS